MMEGADDGGVTVIANDNDVLMGRGRGIQLRPGNKRFREIIKKYQGLRFPKNHARTRPGDDRDAIIALVLTELGEETRFLEVFGEQHNRFREVSYERKIAKIKQALREIPGRRPHMQQRINPGSVGSRDGNQDFDRHDNFWFSRNCHLLASGTGRNGNGLKNLTDGASVIQTSTTFQPSTSAGKVVTAPGNHSFLQPSSTTLGNPGTMIRHVSPSTTPLPFSWHQLPVAASVPTSRTTTPTVTNARSKFKLPHGDHKAGDDDDDDNQANTDDDTGRSAAVETLEQLPMEHLARLPVHLLAFYDCLIQFKSQSSEGEASSDQQGVEVE